MSHHVYQTQGFIIRSSLSGEADRTVFVFTRQLGLLAIHARGARKVSSKLQASLSNYSFIRLCVVRGKNMWRLTDAEEMVSFRASRYVEHLRLVARVAALLLRFVRGEGENEKLFGFIEELFSFLKEEELSLGEMDFLEVLISYRILFALGYTGEEKALTPFLHGRVSKSLVAEFAPHRKEALREINRAIKESQL